MKTCCFAGHAEIYDDIEIIKVKLEEEIINLIKNHNVINFHNGGKGAFDWLCAHTVEKLKNDYPFIKSYCVLSYMPKEKDKYQDTLKIFDETIYPDIEKTPPKFAIIKRNEWMVKNSDFMIAYVNYPWGGAYKTLRYAKKRNLKIINIAESPKFDLQELS